jgi:hypothetical protein
MLVHRKGASHATAKQQPCGHRNCAACGAYARRRRADELADVVAYDLLWRLELDEHAWSQRRQRLRRDRVEYLPIRIGGGRLVVFIDQPHDHARPVADVRAELREVCARLPNGARVRPSKGWPATGKRQRDPEVEAYPLRAGLVAFRSLAASLELEPISLGPDAVRLAWPEPGSWQYQRLIRELIPRGGGRRRRHRSPPAAVAGKP